MFLIGRFLARVEKEKRKFPCDKCGMEEFSSKFNRDRHMKNNCKAPSGMHYFSSYSYSYFSCILVDDDANHPWNFDRDEEEEKKKTDTEKPPEAKMPKIELKETYGYLMIPCKINFTE